MSIDAILPSNFITASDTYKFTHAYPPDTIGLYGSAVPRKASHYTDEIVAAGQTYYAAYLDTVRITTKMIDEAEIEVTEMGYEFNRSRWERIRDIYEGRIPVYLFGVEEGTVIKPNTPMLCVLAEDPKLAFLESFIETEMQRICWKMTTVASQSRYIYKMILEAAKTTGSDLNMVQYRNHNFGDRGADGSDAAILAACAHAMLFSGSDCGGVNRFIKKLYKTKKAYTSSVDATEHSVMCSFSDAEAKDDWNAAVMAVELLEKAVARSKRGIGIPVASVVIDTYDDERFVKEYIGFRLKERIIASGGTLVMRPDSGDPLTRPIEVIEWLAEAFGYTVNAAGYKVLHPAVRVIQGDGINEDSIAQIIKNLLNAGWAMDNLTFGQGGALTHGGGRDTFSFSMKATARETPDGWVNLLKAPKTDMSKKSLTGLVRTGYNEKGELITYAVKEASDLFNLGRGWRMYYNPYKDINYQTNFDEVRERARAGL